LRSERRHKSINLGREMLEAEMRSSGMSFPKFMKNQKETDRVTHALRLGTIDEVLLSIGYGKVAVEDVMDRVRDEQSPDSAPPAHLKPGAIAQLMSRVRKEPTGITVAGIDDVLVRYARCCNPLPGDAIIGFITRGRGVSVHRRECKKAFDTDPERRIEVAWDSRAKINRPVQLSVTTTNRPGILAHVSQTFSGQQINITEANCRTGDDGRALNVFTFHCSDISQLKNVMKALGKVNGVVHVARV
jgi:GTP pyrophosphokinase